MSDWKTEEGYDIPSAIAMWGLFAVGVVLGVAADSMAVMIVFAVIGIAIKATAVARNEDLRK